MNVRIAFLLACGWATAATAAEPDRDRLLVPEHGQDLSAFRLDAEVFGWSADYREVAAEVMEVARGPLGRHRGENYLLVYDVGAWVPKHNVILHNITHADMPHNPIPLSEAKDFLWTIEWSYQQMWPKRPRRTRGRGDMAVEAVWAPRRTDTPEICQPLVSLKMRRGDHVRLMPFRAVDLTATCRLLRLTDTRTYWGQPDLAASMVRFDFASRPHNEESARFLVSASWPLGRLPRVVLEVPQAAAKGAKIRGLERALASVVGRGQVRLVPVRQAGGSGPESGRALVAEVSGGHDWLPLATGALFDAGLEVVQMDAVDGPLAGARATSPARRTPGAVSVTRRLPPAQTPASLRHLQAARAPAFGTDALAGLSPADAMVPPSMAGEAGMVQQLADPSDPIEEAFPEGPEAARPPAAPSAAAPAAPRPAPTKSAAAAKAGAAHKDRDLLRIRLRAEGDAFPQNSSAPSAPAAPPGAGQRPAARPAAPAGRFVDRWTP